MDERDNYDIQRNKFFYIITAKPAPKTNLKASIKSSIYVDCGLLYVMYSFVGG